MSKAQSDSIQMRKLWHNRREITEGGGISGFSHHELKSTFRYWAPSTPTLDPSLESRLNRQESSRLYLITHSRRSSPRIKRPRKTSPPKQSPRAVPTPSPSSTTIGLSCPQSLLFNRLYHRMSDQRRKRRSSHYMSCISQWLAQKPVSSGSAIYLIDPSYPSC